MGQKPGVIASWKAKCQAVSRLQQQAALDLEHEGVELQSPPALCIRLFKIHIVGTEYLQLELGLHLKDSGRQDLSVNLDLIILARLTDQQIQVSYFSLFPPGITNVYHPHPVFSLGSGRIAPVKKGGEKKKGRSAINEVVTQEYTINIHKRIHGMGFKKRAPWALKEIRKFAIKELGTPDVRIDTRLNKAIWAKGIRYVLYCIRVRLSRKRNEDEDSPNKWYTLVTYMPVTTFKNLQTINEDEN
ncbi:60S ribosomal protein L31-like [Phodopus roborovskii]|uniref:60S ribosomal protein L31-like n=1 Tax=Phodopus roborovskii TaxID=109678 RepID=UPI0021E3E538|nr:60S ribosomal protein L31-like [Phodopus roborovskii]